MTTSANSYFIEPCKTVRGIIDIPSSKSVAQRVLACALLNNGTTVIKGLSQSDDEKAAQAIIAAAGAQLTASDEGLVVHSSGFYPIAPIQVHCGESGLSSRMFTPILANSSFPVTIKGSGSLLTRPMHFFDDIAPQLQVAFSSQGGKLPFVVQGPLVPVSVTVDGSLSSQFITGLIYGYVASPRLKKVALQLANPVSIPYIELTLDVLRLFDVDLNFKGNTLLFNGSYCIEGNRNITIEGDWSSASYFLVAAAVFGKLTLKNLSIESKQADKAILDALSQFGAEIEYKNNQLNIVSKQRKSFTFDATHCPDLFPALAVLGSYGTQTSRIKGVHRLLHKESNRAQSIVTEFNKFGVTIVIEEDEMIIYPPREIKGAIINPHNDHRIAMAAAILGLGAKSPSQILNPEVVNKSFPSFFELLESVSAR
jgi:3-phosphoshikimate 1-carboxyvinyltransferase